MPPQAQPSAPAPAAAPIPAPSHAGRNIAATLVVLLLVMVGAGGAYGYYQHQQLTAANAQYAQMMDELATSTQEIVRLQTQVAQLTCRGTWADNACQPISVKVSLNAEPARGASPLAVTFVAKVPNNNYSIDFGDGSTSWLSTGLSGQTAGECIPTENSLCIINVKHTYAPGNAGGSFTAKLMQGGTIVATTSITVING